MESIKEKINTLLELMGFPGADVNVDEDNRKISVSIKDDTVKSQTSAVIGSLEHVVNLISKKEGHPFYVIDVNNYRKERERLISELARAAAHRAMMTKGDVKLPPMNAYERRMVHLEIATHPALKTESEGAGKDRHIVIKHIK